MTHQQQRDYQRAYRRRLKAELAERQDEITQAKQSLQSKLEFARQGLLRRSGPKPRALDSWESQP